MRYMFDSTNIQDDPLDAQLVGFYVDGIYATSVAPVIARFPHAVLVPISAIGTNAGIVGDVEPGCMTVAEAVAWVQMRRAAGADPTLYVNEMHGWAPVRFAFRSAGIPEPHYWVANYDGVATIPAGAVAKQYANPTLTHGHFDLSVVADHWPGVDGLYGPSAEALKEQNEMDTYFRDPVSGAVYNVGAMGKRHVGPAEWSALVSVGRSAAEATPAFLAEVPDIPVEQPEPAPTGSVDLSPVLSAIAAVKADLALVKAKLDKDLA